MAKRTPEQNRATYERRKARAQASGFSSYREQRKYRAQALKLIPGKSKASVAARDRVAKEARDYEKGEAKDPEFRDDFEDIADQFDLTFSEQEWYDFLDILSPKSE